MTSGGPYGRPGQTFGWDPVIADQHVFWMDNGQNDVDWSMRDTGTAPTPVQGSWWCRRDDQDSCGRSRSAVFPTAPNRTRRPGTRARVVVAMTPATRCRAWKLSGDELEPLWQKDDFAHAGHLIVYPDSRELVVQDFRDLPITRRRGFRRLFRRSIQSLGRHQIVRRFPVIGSDSLVVLDLDTGAEKGCGCLHRASPSSFPPRIRPVDDLDGPHHRRLSGPRAALTTSLLNPVLAYTLAAEGDRCRLPLGRIAREFRSLRPGLDRGSHRHIVGRICWRSSCGHGLRFDGGRAGRVVRGTCRTAIGADRRHQAAAELGRSAQLKPSAGRRQDIKAGGSHFRESLKAVTAGKIKPGGHRTGCGTQGRSVRLALTSGDYRAKTGGHRSGSGTGRSVDFALTWFTDYRSQDRWLS